MKQKTACLALLMFACLVSPKIGADDFMAMNAPEAQHPPEVDGLLTDKAWQEAPATSLNDPLLRKEKVSTEFDTTLRFVRTRQTLFVAVECRFPSSAQPVTMMREHDRPVLENASIELFIKTGEKSKHFHLAVNACGATYEAEEFDSAWNEPWQSAVNVSGKTWTVEMGVPFESLGGAPEKGRYWMINACRNVYNSDGRLEQTFALLYPGIHAPLVPLILGPVRIQPLLRDLKPVLTSMQNLVGHIAPCDRDQVDSWAALDDMLHKTAASGKTCLSSFEAVGSLSIVEAAARDVRKITERAILNMLLKDL